MNEPLIYFSKSTSIVDNKIAGRDREGAYIYLYDIKIWKVVLEDGTLADTDIPDTTLHEEYKYCIS